jgi:hypothetical protein
MQESSRTRSKRGLVIGGSLVGLVLFALTIRTVSLASMLEMVRRVGVGFVWILALGGARLAARAAAWTACTGGNSRLPFRSAFASCIVGEGAGNLTPLGLAASEPAKVMWVRNHLGTMESAASLTVETLLYSLTVAVMLAAGCVAALVAFAPGIARPLLLAGVVVCAGLAVLARALRGRRIPTPAFARRWLAAGQGQSKIGAVRKWFARTGEILRTLASREPGTLALVILLEVAFQAAAVAEVWVMLVLLGMPNATFLQAFLLEFANRVVTIVFKFVPMRLGVDELASGTMSSLLKGGTALGVTLAVVRKARVLFWSVVGAALAAGRAVGSPHPEPAPVLADTSQRL